MSVRHLTDELKKELETVFSDFRFNEPEQRVKIFIKDTPRNKGIAEQNTLEPYQVIIPSGGSQDDEEDIANIVILIYTEDKTGEQQGWIDVMNQIDRIKIRFLSNPVFGKCYEVKSINWALADDNPYPKCLGGVELKIAMPEIETEDTFYD